MMILDLVKSWMRELGVDASDSTYEHSAMLGRMALLEFIRRGRGIPDGFFDRSGVHLPPGMRNMRDGEDLPVAILPIGDIDPRVISEVYRIVREVFGLDGRLLRMRQPWPETYSSSAIDADLILEKLYVPEYADGCSRVLAVTAYQMRAKHSKSGWAHGYASLRVPVGIISTAQMQFSAESPDAELPFRNLLKVTIHELGHTFQIQHCKEKSCIMNVPKTGLEELPLNFCVNCTDHIKSKTADPDYDSSDPEATGII